MKRMDRMINRITDFMIDNQMIDGEERAVYLFGLEQLVFLTINIATTMAVSVLLGMWLEGCLFLMVFMPLRRYAGGYHASTRLRCWLFSLCLIFSFLQFIRLMEGYPRWVLPAGAAAGLFVWLSAPVASREKPLDEGEIAAYRKKTRQTLLIETLLMAAFLFVHFNQAAGCAAAAICASAGLLLLAKISDRARPEETCF